MNRSLTILLQSILIGVFAVPALAGTARFSTRALWVDTSGFHNRQATDKLIATCTRAGFNVILPNMLCYRTAWYKTTHLRGSVQADETFDPMAYLLEKAHGAKISVQPWCCVYYEGTDEPSTSEWLNISIDGKRFDKNFLSPANPAVNPYLFSVIKDLLAYDIDGIHLDYIRYPCTAFDYSQAGRKAFKAASGFDQQDFLDHVDRIVSSDVEKFPIRVLHAREQVEKIWETTTIERTLDEAGIGFGFISESLENIAALRVPGLLIISEYENITEPMVKALGDFLRRGGNVLWCDAPGNSIKHNPELAKLAGISRVIWSGVQRRSFIPVGKSALATTIATNTLFAGGSTANSLNGAAAILKFDTGEPAVTVNHLGAGKFMVVGFNAMDAKAGRGVPFLKAIIDDFRNAAGVNTPDVLGEKRAEWVQWRGEQVTQLVRKISEAAKSVNTKISVSSSGGPGRWEFYGCYRDARRWLTEGINDQVFPMNYTPDIAEFADLLKAQKEAVPAGKFEQVFPGIQTYDSQVVDGKRVVKSLDARIVEQELRITGELGYQGFCLFAYNTLSDDIVEVAKKYKN